MPPLNTRPHVDVDGIPTLSRVYAGMKRPMPLDSSSFCSQPSPAATTAGGASYRPNILWNERVSIWQGNIVKLKVDAIVNAANERLKSGGGVCGAIFQAAGRQKLQRECDDLEPLSRNNQKWVKCPPGHARITSAGDMMPEIKHIIHTVGPIGEVPSLLTNAYQNTLELAYEHDIKTIAFPCISTGVYGYDIRKATPVALRAVRDWLDENPDKGKSFARIIFCIFENLDLEVYMRHIHTYFPAVPDVDKSNQSVDTDKDTANAQSDPEPSSFKKAKVGKETDAEAKEMKQGNTGKSGDDQSSKGKSAKEEAIKKHKDVSELPSPSNKTDSVSGKVVKTPSETKGSSTSTKLGGHDSDDDDFVHI
ncbi:hypothetical protein BGW41_005426 [Actinomortierella wolfii]|nr:hypothetical protein BGW41_005426 [Actinomortierella wolfii]